MADEDLFYEGLIADYVGADGYVRRDWLETAVLDRLSLSTCRYVLVAAEPGAGKSGLMADLAHRHPEWLRYFIRRDSTTPLSGGDTASAFLRIGHQLATRRPALFDPDRLEVVVKQRIVKAGPGAGIIGVHIEDLQVSPFHRTAIRVEQDVQELSGRLVGVEVAQATVEPRLLAPETLQYLALFDPAALLAESEPDAQVVVLIDALDEVMRFRGAMSILDWLEQGPEPPSNVRFGLSSRPNPRLQVLRGARAGQIELIPLGPDSAEVMRDTRTFTRRLLTEPAVAATHRVHDTEAAVEQVAYAADGNFAYLRAFERALHGAISHGNAELLDALLRLNALPSGLAGLYSVFLRNAREEISQLGVLEVERPAAPGDDLTPAWEGAGQRMLGVLAVARAPLTLDQLMRLGSIRVWRSAATAVLQRLVPLLDEAGSSWQLFHSSLAEFLTADAALVAPDLGIEGSEWHRRVVRAYRGRVPSWAEVDWSDVDDYGLLHLAEHLVELGDNGRSEVAELVNAGLRTALRRRFLTDLPFKRIAETALAETHLTEDLSEMLATTVFLDVVRAGVSGGGRWLAPAVLGLMARLGRVEEALARAELLAPDAQQFRSFEAILACMPTAKRPLLGGHDGVDRLVSAALEIPATAGSGPVGFRGWWRKNAIEAAAVALAPHDVERALKIGTQAEWREGEHRVMDAVLAAAAREADPGQVLALLERMLRGRAVVAAEAAQRANGSDREALLEVAAQRVDDEGLCEQIAVFAQLVASWLPSHPERGASAAARLREAAQQAPGPNDSPLNLQDRLRAVAGAARTVRNADASLAVWLLDHVDLQAEVPTRWSTSMFDSTAKVDMTVWTPTVAFMMDAARVWAEWGEDDKCRELAERVLTYEQGLGGYQPALIIAALAVMVDAIDPDWAQELADEALALVEHAAQAEQDPFERDQVDLTLGEVVQAFRTWDRERALRAARLMGGSWLPGDAWESFSGRLSALACLGLDTADTDPELAQQLLRECVPDQDPAASFGRPDARLVRGGLFRPAADLASAQASTARMENFLAKAHTEVYYWISGREWRAFLTPADVARSIQTPPGAKGALASWAGVVAAAVEPVAAHDLEAAIDLAGWPTDPCERLVACASLVRALTAAGDVRAGEAMDALGRAVMDLPRYVCEVDLQAIPQAPVLAYLNPAMRARWEAALLLPPDAAPVADALGEATGSWYLAVTLWAQRLWESLLAPVPEGTTRQAVVEAITQELASAEQLPDDIQRDFIRAAAAWALAPYDPDLVDSTIAQIVDLGGVAMLARVFAAHGTADDPAEFTSACLAVLDAAPPESSALYRAVGAAMAAHLISGVNASGAQDLVGVGIAALQDARALEVTAGLALLATVADESRRTELVLTALARANDVDNQLLRNDALADLLGPAVLTRDASLVSAVAQRLLAADWQVLMEGLRRGMDMIGMTAGPGIVAQLDGALRSAQRVLAGEVAESSAHLDAVAAPHLRDNPLTGGKRAAASAPSLSLDPDALYLEAGDLPGYLKLVEDNRGQGPDPDDYAFRGCDGVHAGSRAWLGETTNTIWRLVDIRFVFPDAERAAAYHAERLFAYSDGNPPIDGASLTGDDCRVFGGMRSPQSGEAELTMTLYFYVFRVQNVVVKLHAVQGAEAAEPLIPEQVRRIAERIVARIERTL